MVKKYRHISLLSRFLDIPGDLYFEICIQCANCDFWEALDEFWILIALVMNVLYCAIKIYQHEVLETADFIVYPYTFEICPCDYLEIALIMVSIINMCLLFSSRKSITLLQQPVAPIWPGDITWKVQSANASIVQVNVGVQSDAPPKTEPKWVLRMWNPLKSQLTIFCWFSPMQAAIIYNLNSNNYTFIIPLAIMNIIFLNQLVYAFQMLLKDSSILSGQLLNEFTLQIGKNNYSKYCKKNI